MIHIDLENEIVDIEGDTLGLISEMCALVAYMKTNWVDSNIGSLENRERAFDDLLLNGIKFALYSYNVELEDKDEIESVVDRLIKERGKNKHGRS